ncbi:MAG: GFA family protein [Xanthomonadales bacterium]|nr:GFA family protein [Xanthomonadales bacterium]
MTAVSSNTEATSPLAGSCLCGAVRFEITGEFSGFYLCHCVRCRKDTGSAHAANLFSTTARLQWLAGEAQVSGYELPGTRHGRSFCSRCGSALPSRQLGGKLLVVPAGSLDGEPGVHPTAHIFCDDKAVWESLLPEALCFPGAPA